jgi:flagellar assembly factor FliW
MPFGNGWRADFFEHIQIFNRAADKGEGGFNPRMAKCQSKYLGELEYDEAQSVIEFPAGLPGFEDERGFLPVKLPRTEPLLLLQSVNRPELCFMTLPVLSIDPSYRLATMAEDLKLIGFDPDQQPRIGTDVLCVAILSVWEDRPTTANLLSPLVMNLATRRAVQAIQAESNYSHQHELPAPEPAREDPVPEAACS